MSTHALFGIDVPFDQIASCRVNRLAVSVRGLQTAVARVALGAQRTQVWLTLVDGRSVTSVAKDDPAHARALEAFLQALEVDRVARWEAALGRGETVRAGKVTMTQDSIAVGRRRVQWSAIGGYAFRDGGLMVDNASNRLVFTLWIAATPWSGAVYRMLAHRARGRDYEEMDAAQIPRMSIFATSALTHIPGAMTMRGRGYLLLGLVGAGALAFAVYVIDYELEHARLQRHWQQGVADDAKTWTPRLSDEAAFAAFAPCVRKTYADSYLTGVQLDGGKPKITEGGRPTTELMTYPSDLLVWGPVGGEVRGLYLEDRYTDQPPCRITATGEGIAPLLAGLGPAP